MEDQQFLNTGESTDIKRPLVYDAVSSGRTAWTFQKIRLLPSLG
jgi:hypothetical protein